tara:strand:+ start:206 stop:592 length:387 start_codon:yes stop_codon:yes gene_type:complete
MIREFDDNKDYDEYSSWFNHLGYAPPTRGMLSTLGFTIYKEIDICSGFLYISNSNLAYIEFVIANPKAKREDRKEGVKKLLTHLQDLAKSKGYEIIMIITATPGFSKNLIENFGYIKGPVSIEHYKEI